MGADTVPENCGRVMVIDDDVVMIRTLHSMLTGYENVRFSTSGDRGLEMIYRQLPDVILLDAEMPGMNGYDVCRRLKSDPVTADIPVIFITGHNDPGLEVAALELGAADFIAKPLSPGPVRARIRTQLRMKAMTDRLRQAAFIDGLTGVANRRALDMRLALEWRRALRNRVSLSVMFADVDYFKRYNDRYGHLEGDQALRFVAATLFNIVRRPSDLVGRYGGEEFAVLLPETPHSAALTLAERVRLAVSDLEVRHESSPHGVLTLSIGVATMDFTAEPARYPRVEDTSPDQLMNTADQALYGAKAGGRNRVFGRVTEFDEISAVAVTEQAGPGPDQTI